MATIVTRSGKGSPLTHAEVDANFTNLNTDKLELSGGTMTGNLSFGDNDKAIFGAGSDLQIYHDGSNSNIKDVGTGPLKIFATDLYINNSAGNKTHLSGIDGGAVTLYYNGSSKLATTSTGIDVTGTVTADALTISAAPSPKIQVTDSDDSNTAFMQADGANGAYFGTLTNHPVRIAPNNSTKMIITTAGYVGIGTNSPSHKLHVSGTGSVSSRTFATDTGGDASFFAGNDNGQLVGPLVYGSGKAAYGALGTSETALYSNRQLTIMSDNGSGIIKFATGGNTERLRIDSSGNLLVGKTAPNIGTAGAEVKPNGNFTSTANGDWAALFNRLTSDGDIVQFRKDGTTVGSIGSYGSGSGMYLGTGDTGIAFNSTDDNVFPRNPSTNLPRDNAIDLGSSTARFKDLYLSGTGYVGTSLGIGTTSPSAKLHSNVGAASTIGVLAENANDAASTGDLIKAYSARGDTSAYNLFKAQNSTGVKFLVSGDGNVGIGRSAPSHPLHIGDTSGNTILELQRTNTNASGTVGAISFTASDDHSVAAIHASGDGDNEGAHLIFRTTSAASQNNYFNSTSERMRISSAGLVGIGTSSPAGTLHLHSADTALRLTSSAGSNTPLAQLQYSGSGGYFLRMGDSSDNEDVMIRTYGNSHFNGGSVGIGTNSPSSYNSGGYRLVVGDGAGYEGITIASGSAQEGGLYFADGTTGNETYRGHISYNHSNDSMHFKTAASERMRIDSSGNLLVGKTALNTDTTGLQLESDGYLSACRDGGNVALINRKTSDGALVTFQKDGSTVGSIGSNTTSGQSLLDLTATQNFRLLTNGSERMRIDSSGNVGIGTTTVGQIFTTDVGLTVDSGNAYSGIHFTDGATSGALAQGYSTTYLYNRANGSMLFGTNDTERMRIDSNGALIVGATTGTGQYNGTGSNGMAVNNAGQAGQYVTIQNETDSNIYLTKKSGWTDNRFIQFSTNATSQAQITYDSSLGVLFRTGTNYRTSFGTAGFWDGTSSGNNVGIRLGGAHMYMTDGNGSIADGTRDIGRYDRRVRDIYLSGGVYLGGTGSANLLDDYEEGTWTPTLSASTTAPTVSSYSDRVGRYVKVGRMVTAMCQIRANLSSAGSGYPIVTGLPFTSQNIYYMGASVGLQNLFTTAPKEGFVSFQGTSVRFDNATYQTGVNNYICFNITYEHD